MFSRYETERGGHWCKSMKKQENLPHPNPQVVFKVLERSWDGGHLPWITYLHHFEVLPLHAMKCFITLNGPSHLLQSFPCPNNLTLELKNNTLSPRVNYFLILLSCHLFVLSLYILALWYAFSHHSSSSESCIFLLVLAASKVLVPSLDGPMSLEF